jgi:D-beta-D-heptose 7-phosphate kinase/D-beta-D-heptose 1-phosphate adenosyltransferase
MPKKISELAPKNWNTKRLTETLSSWAGKKILVVGDVGVDRYTEGKVERISPEAPVPIVRVVKEAHKLGLAANVADNIQALGGVPLMVGMVGKDSGAQLFRKLVRDAGMSDEFLVEDGDRRTILKERIIGERQQLMRIDYEDSFPYSARVEKNLIKQIDRALEECDGVILEDYAKGLLTPKFSAAVISRAKKKRKWIAADPNPRSPKDIYQGVTVITPNQKEAEAMAGLKITDTQSLLEVGTRLLKITQGKHVIITRGPAGMALFTRRESKVVSIPTFAREVYDVSGAGDTVIATLSLAQAVGASLTDGAILANLAAGVEVGKWGTATVTPEEILQAMKDFPL